MADQRGAFLGSGRLYIAPYETPSALAHIGNVSRLEYQPETQDIELQDYTNPGGGLDASVQRITAVNISFDARHLNLGNMSRAVFGTITEQSAGSVSGEEHMATPGALVVLKNPGGTGHVVTIDGSPSEVLVEGEDYSVTAAGNLLILEGGAINQPTEIEVDYDFGGYGQIEAMTATGARFRLYFEGVNEVNGKATTLDAYKVGFSPSTLDMIGDDFANMPFEGKCERDDRVSAAVGISQFLKIQSVD